jgi:polyether ionophore transport system permease protein
MTSLTGTPGLLRFIMRRDRIRILIWIVAIGGLAALTVAGIAGLFPTQAALDQTTAATEHNAAAIAFNGAPLALNTLGGQVAFQFGAFGMVLVALMNIFTVGRLTRGEEEAGRLEVVRSLPVGIHANTLATAITVGAMNLAVGVVTAGVLMAQGLPALGSVVLGASFALVGLFFAGVAVLVAQVTESTRVVYGTAGAVLGAAYVVRAIGDIGDGMISWLSPIGVAQKARPYADERWWPLLLLLVGTVVLVAAATALAVRRDLGAGLVAARPGPSAAAPSLGSPLGLAFRLQRGSLLGWAGGVLVLGIAYGWIGPTIDAFVGQNKALAELLVGTGGGSLTDLYFATAFRIMALVATGFAVQAVLRIRGEETSMRAELVLATPVSRWRFGGSHLALAFAGSVVLLTVAGLATGVSYGLAGGGLDSVPRLLEAALVYAPAMWLMAGIAIALAGLAPRLTGVSWAILVACLIVGFLGPVLGLPTWLRDLSPFQEVPQLPAASLTLLPLLAIAAVAAGLTALGLMGLRRRDIGRT